MRPQISLFCACLVSIQGSAPYAIAGSTHALYIITMARKHWKCVSGSCVKEETFEGDGGNLIQSIRKSSNDIRGCYIRSEHEKKLDVPEMRMLRLMCIIAKLGRIRNERIRDTAKMDEMSNKMQETGLKLIGHVIGRAEGHVGQHRWDGLERKHERQDWYIGRRMIRMELPGKRKRGRPKRRFVDMVKEDMAEVEVTEEDQ